MEKRRKDLYDFLYRIAREASIGLTRFDQERTHPIGRLNLYSEWALGLVEEPKPIIICVRMQHLELLDRYGRACRAEQ